MADAYGTWAVTMRDRKGKETTIQMVDLKSAVREQAGFFGPTYGKVVKVEAAPAK